MLDRSEYLKNFMQEFEYPAEASHALLKTYYAILENSDAYAIFEQMLRLYESDLVFDYGGWVKMMPRVSKACNEPSETVDLVFVLCLSEHLRELYLRRGLDIQIYKDSCLDFKAKLMECHDIRGIWGTFVTDWFSRFFNLTRFALGRLQFEINPVPSEISAKGRIVHAGDPAVSIHIPSIGPLSENACRESFIKASEFFACGFKDGVVPFRCGSWLLAPEHRHMLKPDANILKFMNFFNITPQEKTVEGDLWRIFGQQDCSNISALPRDNSLRRAYASEIEKGNMPHIGIGLFFMKDGKFL